MIQKVKLCKYCGYGYLDEKSHKDCERTCKQAIEAYMEKHKTSFAKAKEIYLSEAL